SVRKCLCNWETDISEIFYFLPIGGKISARTLRAAFQNMSGDGSGSEFITVVIIPSKFIDHRSKCKSRIRRTTGNNDLCTLTQGFYDWHCAEIDIGAENPTANICKGFA